MWADTALWPQILVGQIFTQQQRLLSKEEGGGRPVAGGPFRLLPIPLKRQLGESEPNRSPQPSPTHPPQAQSNPSMHAYLGVTSISPPPQAGNRRRAGLGGI